MSLFPKVTEEFLNSTGIDLAEYPVHVQLLCKMFMMVDSLEDGDIIYYCLDTIKSLAINEAGLSEISVKHKKLFIWMQHNHLIPSLWSKLQSCWSQVSMII